MLRHEQSHIPCGGYERTSIPCLEAAAFLGPQPNVEMISLSLLLPASHFSSASPFFTDPCDYIGPTWVFQANFPISRSVTTSAKSLSPFKITYSQVAEGGQGCFGVRWCSAYHRSVQAKATAKAELRRQRPVSVNETPKFIRLNPKGTSRSAEKGLCGTGR